MNFRHLFLILLLGIGLFAGCSNATNISPQDQLLNGTWNLKNLSGGFAGLNVDYPNRTVTWIFNSQNQTIIIENNASPRFTFESGTYNYSIIEVNDQKYLLIDNNEFGGLTISSKKLIIDQNKFSYGVGADGFILNFEK